MPPQSPAASAILSLLALRDEGRTICPSEAARIVDPKDWRDAMPAVHAAARVLVAEGAVVLTQSGEIVRTDAVVGAYRIRKADREKRRPR